MARKNFMPQIIAKPLPPLKKNNGPSLILFKDGHFMTVMKARLPAAVRERSPRW